MLAVEVLETRKQLVYELYKDLFIACYNYKRILYNTNSVQAEYIIIYKQISTKVKKSICKGTFFLHTKLIESCYMFPHCQLSTNQNIKLIVYI